MPNYGIEDDFGFNKKPLTQIVDDMQIRMKEQFGDNIDLSETSTLSQIIRTISLEIAGLWDIAEDVYHSPFLEYATGEDLDRIAQLMGQHREPAQYASGTVTFTTDGSALTISENTEVQSDKCIYNTSRTKEVSQGTTSVDVPVIATSPGLEYNIPINSIKWINDPVSGLLSVTNSSKIDGGTDIESDQEFRSRIRNAILIDDVATRSAIRQAVLDVDDVKSVTIIESDTPGRIYVYVGLTYGLTDGEQDTIIEDQIKPTINDIKACGIDLLGVEATDGIQINVSAEVYIKDEADITQESAKAEIIDNIQKHIRSLGSGDNVVYAKIYDVIYNTADWIYDIESGGSTTADIPEIRNVTELGNWTHENILIDSSETAAPVDDVDISVVTA